jgi:mannose-6-phosphate isomerase-like protein (cupin superfamily)
MAPCSRVMLCAFVMTGALFTGFSLSQTSEPEGHVTAIFHDVQLLPEQADARPAAMNDKVDDGTALRTGDDSRSELTFADLTITRLGANTIFSFNKAGRSVRLDSGSILLYARKNSGAAQISTKAVSVGITGTTVIFESRADSYDRLIVLEGDARFSLNNFPDQSTEVRAGQLLNVKAGAKKLPKPGRVDLRRIIKTYPLIKNFPPLPSLDLILAVADGRNPNRPPPPPQPVIGGAVSQGGPSSGYVPNQPVVTGGTQIGPVYPNPTPTPKVHRPSPTPHPTVKPTPHRPVSHPTSTPKKRLPPRKRATPAPTPGQIIR